MYREAGLGWTPLRIPHFPRNLQKLCNLHIGGTVYVVADSPHDYGKTTARAPAPYDAANYPLYSIL